MPEPTVGERPQWQADFQRHINWGKSLWQAGVSADMDGIYRRLKARGVGQS